MPVSYASPTYYADHLAQRGRKYFKDFLDGRLDKVCRQHLDFTGHDQSNVNVSTIFTCPNALRAALKDTNDVDHEDALSAIHAAANKVFRLGRFADHPNTSARGPWHKNLDDKVFWL